MHDRFVPVLSAKGEWLEDAALALLGVMVFPNCERSVWHFHRTLGEDEATTPGAQSEVGRIISEDVLARKRQGHVAGQVALRLIDLSIYHPQKISLNRAVYLTVEAAKEATVQGKPFKPRSTTGVRDAVSHFRSVTHLWAAQVAFPKLFEETALSLDRLAEFLAVAAVIEGRLEGISVWPDWNPWRVPASLVGDMAIKIPPMSEDVETTLSLYHPVLRD